MVALGVLAIVIFGPERLPKVISEVARFIRRVRAFSDSAREDIRRELGPEFKDFEFEDLNPRTFVRKNLLEPADVDLREIRELGSSLRDDIEESVTGVAKASPTTSAAGGGKTVLTKGGGATGAAGSAGAGSGEVSLVKPGERPPFDVDAT
ncbi:sec-independent translocase [Allostreptomyces psammosilenae]